MKSQKLSTLKDGISSFFDSARKQFRYSVAALGLSAFIGACAPQPTQPANDGGMDARTVHLHTDIGSRRADHPIVTAPRLTPERPAPAVTSTREVANEGVLFGEHSVLPNGANANPEGGATGALLEGGMELKEAQRLAFLLNPAMMAARNTAAADARTGNNTDLADLIASRRSGIRTAGTDSVKIFKREMNGVTEYKVQVSTHGHTLWQTNWVNPINNNFAAAPRATPHRRVTSTPRMTAPRATDAVVAEPASTVSPAEPVPAPTPPNPQIETQHNAQEIAETTVRDLVGRLNAHPSISPWLRISPIIQNGQASIRIAIRNTPAHVDAGEASLVLPIVRDANGEIVIANRPIAATRINEVTLLMPREPDPADGYEVVTEFGTRYYRLRAYRDESEEEASRILIEHTSSVATGFSVLTLRDYLNGADRVNEATLTGRPPLISERDVNNMIRANLNHNARWHTVIDQPQLQIEPALTSPVAIAPGMPLAQAVYMELVRFVQITHRSQLNVLNPAPFGERVQGSIPARTRVQYPFVIDASTITADQIRDAITTVTHEAPTAPRQSRFVDPTSAEYSRLLAQAADSTTTYVDPTADLISSIDAHYSATVSPRVGELSPTMVASLDEHYQAARTAETASTKFAELTPATLEALDAHYSVNSDDNRYMDPQEAAVILSRVREDQESKSLQASIRSGARTALSSIKGWFRSNVG